MSDRLLITQEIGSFRKPVYLSSVFRKTEHDELLQLQQKATVETLQLFRDAGLENIGVAGEMFRWEMYEHMAAALGGVEFFGPVRSFDNRYYRKGSIVSGLERKNSFHEEELRFLKQSSDERIKFPITGPYTMADWSFNEHYRDKRELALAFADVINHEITHLRSLWNRSEPFEVQIDEPAATTHPGELDIVVESVNRSIENIKGCEFSMHVCYSSDYSTFYRKGTDLKLHGYNLEFANRDTNESGMRNDQRKPYRELSLLNDIDPEKFIGIGVTDVHSDFIEPPELIVDRISAAVQAFGDPAKVRVNPDCGLRTRSRDIGFQKLKNMVAAARTVRSEYQ